jgi:hypothetical protein
MNRPVPVKGKHVLLRFTVQRRFRRAESVHLPPVPLSCPQRIRWRDPASLPGGEQGGQHRGQHRDTHHQPQLFPGDAENQAGVELLEKVDGEDILREDHAENHP